MSPPDITPPAPPEGFDWDPDKYLVNLHKHKIPFLVAAEAFLDPNGWDARCYLHEDAKPAEYRYDWLGVVSGVCLYVTYTIRDDIVRIISARKAERREVDVYFRGP